MTKVNRENLLQQLEAVQPGLSPKPMLEQSSSFVFRDGMVHTYNEEMACSYKCDLQIEGAVPASALLAKVRAIPDEDVEIEADGEELRISGRRKRGGIRMDTQIVLPSIKLPKEWSELPSDFIDAVKIVKECAGKDEQKFASTCVHFTKDFIEAFNYIQVIRYTFKKGLPIKSEFLVRSKTISHIVDADMSHMSESKSWAHFRNGSKLYMSCRRYDEEYQSDSVEKILSVKGEKFILPKGLKDAAERCLLSSSENAENDDIFIELSADKLKIKGSGTTSWWSESKTVKYKGDPVSFGVPPKMLAEIAGRYNDCEIAPGKLKIDGGKYKYVTCLSKATE